MNQLERNVTEAIKDAEASGTRTAMVPLFTLRTILDEAREGWKWRAYVGPAVFLSMIVAFLFGVWLAGKSNTPPCPAPKLNVGTAAPLGTSEVVEPNMMTVSLVHRFRFQNKG